MLAHDHRTFGSSSGTPRHDVNPWQQIADWRRAISRLESRPEVDPDRIGVWGTSFAGGHALVLGATDRRLRAVVAQVPVISGMEIAQRRVLPEHVAQIEKRYDDDERAQLAGSEPATVTIVSKDPGVPALYHDPEVVDFYLRPFDSDVPWENKLTLRSSRNSRMYEPGVYVGRISPTPLLMIVGRNDNMTPTDMALAAYERALEPKRLALIPGGHFSPYLEEFEAASGAALDWSLTHLS
ncbi:alpha/beta hydrolase [Streptomyces spiralis]